MLTINNEYNINERKFNFITDEDIFKNSLLKDIDRAIKENKKIAICSMSKTDTIKYNDILLAHNKDLKILLINADTDDEDKKKMKHIKQYIINYDVFIYSPSIEAGVNIDIVDMFNNLYCIVCGGSTSPRSFLQMTARIRHLNNNNINILNHSLNNNKCNNYWEFEEVKNMLNNSHELRMRRETKTEEDKTFTIFKMTPYSETYIYNKLEKLNNNSYYFINLLCLYCKQKGIETIFNEEQERTYIKLDKDEYFERIIKLKTIDKDENNELQRKINNRTASRDEKLQQSKYFYLAFLCVDKLNVDIMNAFYKQLEPIKNFIKLIDDVKINNASIIYEKFDKIKIVKSIIANMGFCHVFDKDTIHQDKFKIKIDAIRTEHPEYFSKETRALFNMAKFKTDTTTDKAILGHINSLLRNFSIQIKATRQREYGKTNLISFYGLEHLNNVDEILYYKMQKGRPVVDINNIIKIDTKKFIYNDLINKHDDKDINKKIVDIGNLDNGLIFDDDDIIDELNKLEIDLTDY